MKKIQFFLLTFFLTFSSIAQKHFKVKVQFPSSINLGRLVFYANDGKDNQKIKSAPVAGVLTSPPLRKQCIYLNY